TSDASGPPPQPSAPGADPRFGCHRGCRPPSSKRHPEVPALQARLRSVLFDPARYSTRSKLLPLRADPQALDDHLDDLLLSPAVTAERLLIGLDQQSVLERHLGDALRLLNRERFVENREGRRRRRFGLSRTPLW